MNRWRDLLLFMSVNVVDYPINILDHLDNDFPFLNNQVIPKFFFILE